MTTSEETNKEPLWWAIEESLLALGSQTFTGENKESIIQKIAKELDDQNYNVSGHGGHMLALRWAVDDMIKVGRPMLKDFNAALAAFKLEELDNPYDATYKLLDDLGKTWKKIKSYDRRLTLIQTVENTKLDLIVKKAKSLDSDEGIRLLIGENVDSQVIVSRLDITHEKLDQVNAEIAKEIAAKNEVLSLLEKVANKTDEEKVRHLIDNNITEKLIIEVAKFGRDVIDKVKQTMEEELKEKQRLAEEAAARKKAEAEGPTLEDIPADQMIDYIDSIREILEFSDVEKEIRGMCEQSAIPKSLVDIAVSDPDKLDELEKEAEG